MKSGGPVEPQGLLSKRPAPKLILTSPAKFSPAAQLSQSVNHDILTSGGLQQVQCNSNASVQDEYQHQSQNQKEQAAGPLRENTPPHPQATVAHHEQQQTLLEDQAAEEKPQGHPQRNKSQSLINAFGLKDTSVFRTAREDTANAETIRNLRKSFANLFSE
ncbi:synapsin-2-like [Seriola dumerili]|uniref:synapsin-2-like n=1 Tax=Seriola dumerili TaxID=41447 RepID=UPI000BBEF585|nr:synapsin-2-like [Seriola dumerili]